MVTLQPNGIDDTLGVALPRVRPRPSPSAYPGWQSLLLLLGDAALFVLAGFASLWFTQTAALPVAGRPDVILTLLLAGTLVLAIYDRLGLYRHSYSSSARDELYASLAGSLLGLLPTAILLVLLPSLGPYRHQLALAVMLAAAGLSVWRFSLHLLHDRLVPLRPRRIVIAGAPERVDAVPGFLSLRPADAVLRMPLARFDAEMEEATRGGGVAGISWLEHATAWNCDTLVLTEALPAQLMPAILRHCEVRGIRLAFAPLRIRPNSYDLAVHRDGGVALLCPQPLAICTPGADVLRRTFDLALAIPALVLLSPLFAAIGAIVALDGGRPVFFKQTRVGRHGKEFDILKFRTMRRDAEAVGGPTWAKRGDARITRVGRWLRRTSFDELPQLINVIRGDMSLVGPRPERPHYVERFRRIVPRYDERHMIRPGIAGWAQVNMRRILDPSATSEKLSYDLFYMEHWSLVLDATILLKTAFEFLFHDAG